MPELRGEYLDKNIVDTLLRLLDDYNIYNKISYIMTDNAINNDTMIEALEQNLQQLRWRCSIYGIQLPEPRGSFPNRFSAFSGLAPTLMTFTYSHI